jgi:hypothetical protein
MYKISIIFSLLLSGLYSNAQVVTPIDPGPCGYDLTIIRCKYDGNGNRIFRGFDLLCPPPQRPASQGDATANVKQPAQDANQAATIAGSLAPNPTRAESTLRLAELPPAGAFLYVHDVQGRLLEEQYADAQTLSISLAPYTAGIYFVAVVHKGKVLYQSRVVKID